MLIIHRYIFRGLIPPFFINLLFLTTVFLMTEIVKITQLIVNYNVSPATIGLILLFSIPHFLVFVLPMSVMLAVLLTLMRMSGDNEIAALKSGGVSLYKLMPPIIIFSVAACLATLFMTVYGMPQGKIAIKQLTYKMLASNTDIGLKARTFVNQFQGVTLYVNEVNLQNRKLKDVFIEDRRNPKAVSTVIAPEGLLLKDSKGWATRLRLYNGMINQVEIDKRSANASYFSTYDINLVNMVQRIEVWRNSREDESEMTLAELKDYIIQVRERPEKYYDALIVFHQKFSIPAACLTLGILAIPLGVELQSSRRSAGLGMGMLIFILYYVLMTAGRVFGQMGFYHPALGLWAPNILFGIGGVIMLIRAANEKPNYVVQFMRSVGGLIQQRVLGWLRRFVRA
ncbi:MAG: LPS export ABC transporter permease LptF [Deltaproteobacteria bacterium]|jgi:lipopolysaccharide export system permease protein|nr:LPS export ABC transporter permease LptF [Deltaproteobacteria bacterium]